MRFSSMETRQPRSEPAIIASVPFCDSRWPRSEPAIIASVPFSDQVQESGGISAVFGIARVELMTAERRAVRIPGCDFPLASFTRAGKKTMWEIQPDSHMPGRFPTTQWSRVVTASSRDAPEAREALSSLCQAYWYPIYAYIRHRGYTLEQAHDLTQDFFAYVLERDLFAKADPARGRFRAFLRTVCARHLAALRDQERAAKRGGGRSFVSIDPLDAERRYMREPAHELTPERIFDRTWALTLLERVVERLRREYDDAGRTARFEELITLLTRDPITDTYCGDRRAAGYDRRERSRRRPSPAAPLRPAATRGDRRDRRRRGAGRRRNPNPFRRPGGLNPGTAL